MLSDLEILELLPGTARERPCKVVVALVVVRITRTTVRECKKEPCV